ncbi:MAG: 1,4-dihydroxy-6-naphthoate synthase [Thermodesulfovibrionales bacterium]
MLTFGFSPCPNDTYIFYALSNGLLDTGGLDFQFIIEDVETLNNLALQRRLDISKVSCHAFYYLRDDFVFLNCGGAFGRGCGPLVIKKGQDQIDFKDELTVAVPGRLTTAYLLFKIFSRHNNLSIKDVLFMPFNEIMPSVKKGISDIGVIIHEGRFTYKEYGLIEIADLGKWWEDITSLPIPLGGIAAKRSIGEDKIKKIEQLIIQSIDYSDKNIDNVMPYIKGYAQELADSVIKDHIGLYVNEYTRMLSDECDLALKELIKMAEGV